MIKKKLLIIFFLAMAFGLFACGGGGDSASVEYDPAVVEIGQTKYDSTCSACHGVDLQGVENLGKTLIASEYVDAQSDEELATMIKTGRPTGHELNTTGIDMPPKGGNPALSEDDIFAIVAYIRTSK